MIFKYTQLFVSIQSKFYICLFDISRILCLKWNDSNSYSINKRNKKLLSKFWFFSIFTSLKKVYSLFFLSQLRPYLHMSNILNLYTNLREVFTRDSIGKMIIMGMDSWIPFQACRGKFGILMINPKYTVDNINSILTSNRLFIQACFFIRVIFLYFATNGSNAKQSKCYTFSDSRFTIVSNVTTSNCFMFLISNPTYL